MTNYQKAKGYECGLTPHEIETLTMVLAIVMIATIVLTSITIA